MRDLASFFYPENVVVIGVSPEANNLGRNIVQNLLTFGFKGEILTVGLKPGVIFGQRIYQSLDQIDHTVDLAVILTPARTIPAILDQCGRKGIKRVVIESGGFSEMGEEGVPLEAACVAAAERYNIRFTGPNGIGVTNLENGLVTPFMPLRRDISTGSVSILAQSGGVGLSYLGFMAEENIGINKFVSMGNKLNVDENDLLEYLIHDEGTKIILIYLEGFKDGRRFIEIAATSKKPILVHKSNRFEVSGGIAYSHTAALFADDALVDAALEQAGCVRVNTMADAMDYVKILTLPPLKGNRLGVVSRSGGHAVIAADACAHYGFELPPFPEEFLKAVESRFRAKVIRLQNPMDLGDLFELTFYQEIVEGMLKRDDIDGVLLGHVYRRGYEQEDSRKLVQNVETLVTTYKKPVATVIFTDAVEKDFLKRNSSIPIFEAPENAMRALHFSHWWSSRILSDAEKAPPSAIDPDGAREILSDAAGQGFLYLNGAMDLLRCYGLRVGGYRLASTADTAVAAWRQSGGAVAMKLNRPHVSHKTDVGGVKLGLNTEEAILEAFRAMIVAAGTTEPIEVLIQPMSPPGREVIIGGKQDPVFGPVVLFGLGGVLVEAIGDVVWRVAPIGSHDARQMMGKIKGKKILSGVRGEGPADMAALEDALLRVSALLVDFPEIQEIDINPVRVAGEGAGATALDARIILNGRMNPCGPSGRC
jgi:acyl-CoA synthetase (NDP forming)